MGRRADRTIQITLTPEISNWIAKRYPAHPASRAVKLALHEMFRGISGSKISENDDAADRFERLDNHIADAAQKIEKSFQDAIEGSRARDAARDAEIAENFERLSRKIDEELAQRFDRIDEALAKITAGSNFDPRAALAAAFAEPIRQAAPTPQKKTRTDDATVSPASPLAQLADVERILSDRRITRRNVEDLKRMTEQIFDAPQKIHEIEMRFERLEKLRTFAVKAWQVGHANYAEIIKMFDRVIEGKPR